MRHITILFSCRRLGSRITGILLIIAVSIGLYSVAWPHVASTMGSLENRVIVVDPGHGGIDGGANGPGFLEKEVNLQIARRVEAELRQHKARVVLTRREDVDLHEFSSQSASRHRRDLWARIKIIRDASPDLFLSIHVNASPRRPSTSGPMVFYSQETSGAGKLAQILQKKLNKMASAEGFREHKARPGNFFLLNNVSHTGVIIEVGFMTNSREKEFLQSEEYQIKVARAISEGVREYLTGGL